MPLDLMIWRRGADPAAETCEQALRELMHLPVFSVQRAELWRFWLPEDRTSPEEARRLLQQAACRGGRYVNLNRDVCGWFEGPRPYPGLGPPDGFAVDIWVHHGDGGDATALEYFRRPAMASLHALRRGILWRLVLPANDAEAARALAEEVAVTRSRRRGLLANPHAQTHEVLYVVCGPEAKERR